MSKTQPDLTEIDRKMDFWFKNGRNVLLSGQQGVGKSTLIENMVARNNVNAKYFTASLMDPYLTLIGVPKEGKTADGKSFLDFIAPVEFSDDAAAGVEFIFLDEYNRAPKAVRNSTMELIQFKSVNGRKFPNLKAVWAAINPYDDNETFDVFEIDPAQKDRFHIHHDLPFTPSQEYFTLKFGRHMGDTAIKWWNKIPEDIQRDVSPRRLDYALEEYEIGGDVADVLPELSRPDALLVALKDFAGGEGSHTDRWLADSEGYLNEITDRTNLTDIDVPEAMAALKAISMDQAVDYVGQLLPAQLQELRDTECIDLMLRNFNLENKSANVESALRSAIWHKQHASFMQDAAKEKTSPEFFKEYEAGNFDGMFDTAKIGLEYAIVMMHAIDNMADDFPVAKIREFVKRKPKILPYFAMCSYEETAKIFLPDV